MDNTAIVLEAVKKSQEIAREKGLIPGKNVAHPDDPYTYGLISVDNGIATVGLSADESPSGEEIRKQFPLNELFNPCTAKEQVIIVLEEHINNSAPPNSGSIFIEL